MPFSAEVLVNEIFYRPALWKEEHLDYKKRGVWANLWAEVAEKSSLSTADEAKNKWRNMKDQYRKELRKMSQSNSEDSGTSYVPKWKYFHLLGFLREYVLFPTANQTIEDEDSEESTLSPLREDELSDDAITPEHHVQKESLQDIGQHIVYLEKEKLHLLEESMESDKPRLDARLENADLIFFRCLLPYMKDLYSLEKLELRQEIQQLIIDRYKGKKRNKNNCVTNDENMKVER